MDTCSLSYLFRKITERTLSASNCQATFYLPTTSQSSGVLTPGNLDRANKCQVTWLPPHHLRGLSGASVPGNLGQEQEGGWIFSSCWFLHRPKPGGYRVWKSGRPSTWNNGAPDPDLLYFFSLFTLFFWTREMRMLKCKIERDHF